MKKILLLGLLGFLMTESRAQNVGIGTTTPRKAAKLHIVGDNTDTSFAAYIDGNALGTGLQVARGGVGIGPFRPASRLFVATSTDTVGIDAFAAIVGYSRSDSSAAYGGVYGSYDPNLYGVGMQGVGFNGFDFLSLFGGMADVGVHGSANDIGVSGVGGTGVNAYGNEYGVYAEALDFTGTPPDAQYGIFASTANGTAVNRYAGYFDGNVTITGELSKGSGTFKIDNPLDPANKYLYHSFVESPDMMNIYNGNVTTDADGIAIVTLPDYFDALNKEFRYQLTSIGSFSQAIIKEEVIGNHFIIQTNQPNVKVSWQVTGVRKDKYAEAHRVQPVVEKEPWNRGLYLHAKEFGMDRTQSIGWRASLKAAPQPNLQSTRLFTPKKTIQKPQQPLNPKLSLVPIGD